MSLSYADIAVIPIYAVSIFTLAQWVSREKAGHVKNSKDYFLASRNLPWWAIGTSLIAANISAEQIIGMSGSGYVIGLGIASYEWMAALTLLIVGKFFLPIFLKNQISTMPEFLQRRYGSSVRLVMAIFWLGLYVFVNLTSILWLGATAVHTVTGLDIEYAMLGLGLFAGGYALYGGLKAVALTDIVQVSLLVLGGLVIATIALEKISGGTGLSGVLSGFHTLRAQMPGKFQMILAPDNPNYKDLPGLSVLYRRHVDHEPVLLGVQSIHHSTRLGGEGYGGGAVWNRACGFSEAAHARACGAAGDRRGNPGAAFGQARSGLSVSHDVVADRFFGLVFAARSRRSSPPWDPR